MTLRLTDVRAEYGSGRRRFAAVDGVSCHIARGETLGLVGESGCGKSTLARVIVGLVPMVDGAIHVDDADCSSTASRHSRAFRRRVQMVFQDPFSSLNPRMSVGEMLSEAVSMAEVARGSREGEARRLLDMVEMPASSLTRYPHEFSGGQRQRLALARALAPGPDLILHDEVTSALDVSVQGTILNLLRDLQRELGLSYLFISHDLSTVRYMSDRVAVMYLGRIVEAADTEDLFAGAAHPYTQALIDSIPRFGQERQPSPLSGSLPDPRNPPTGCRFRTRCPVGPIANDERMICVRKDPQAHARFRAHEAACHFAPNARVR